MLFLDEFGFAEPTFRALDAAVDFFLGGDDRGVGLGEQRIEGTLEEVFLDGGHVFPFGLGFLEDPFEYVLPCPHDEV